MYQLPENASPQSHTEPEDFCQPWPTNIVMKSAAPSCWLVAPKVTGRVLVGCDFMFLQTCHLETMGRPPRATIPCELGDGLGWSMFRYSCG